MATDAEWSLDFCLSCDKQTTDGLYCSQACRLSDMERSGSPQSAAASPSSSFNNGFHLPPAVDFSSYKSHPSSKHSSLSSIDTSYFDSSNSSRSDSSTASSPSSALPRGTRLELQQYEDAFDSSRHRRQQQQQSVVR